MNFSEIKVGTIATAKVGRNVVEVTILAVTETGWQVKSNSSKKEFHVTKLEQIISEPIPVTTPIKGLSLLNASAKVLIISDTPLNTKELIAKAIELNLWQPNGAKTPEQSLQALLHKSIC